ncbi:MAG: hypothetical protein ACE37K_15460 [Planctomycetota bacterium]
MNEAEHTDPSGPARRRLFDAELAQAMDVPIDRFAVDDAEGETAAASSPAPRPRRRWVEAAVVLLGLFVTVAVVQMRAADREAGPQEPVRLDPPQPLPIVAVMGPDSRVPATASSMIFSWHPASSGLERLLACERLRYLWLQIPSTVRATHDDLARDCLEPLAELPALENLHLQVPAALDAERLRTLTRLPRLRFLTLTLRRDLVAADLDVLRRLRGLVGLELVAIEPTVTLDVATLRMVASMPSLQSLGLAQLCGCTEAVLRELRGCHQLRRLRLAGLGRQPAAAELGIGFADDSVGLTEPVARALADLPLLDELRLESVAVSAAAIRALPRQLTGLKLTMAPDAGADVYRAIGEMPSLRRLHLGRAIRLRAFSHPTQAVPTEEEAREAGMPQQAQVQREVASLLRSGAFVEWRYEYPMADEVREALAEAHGVQRVELTYPVAADVAAAAAAPDLVRLQLVSCGRFGVAPLQAARSLRELHLRWSSVGSLSWLREQLPEVTITAEN